MSQLNT